MTTIIAGRFGQQSEIDDAVLAFEQAGVPPERLGSFFVNPAGQHDRFSIGGDHAASAGAEHSDAGAAAGGATGGAIGLAVGLAVVPLVGPAGLVAGALTGVHVGNLVGALNRMEDDGGQDNPAVRHSGLMLAVSTPDAHSEQDAIALLRRLGAIDLERGEGRILGGDWPEFDPLAAPRLIEH